jgi:hypothetical protein
MGKSKKNINNTAAITFGRFSVLHKGHDLLIDAMREEPNADILVYISKKELSKTDPLLYLQKLYFMKLAYGNVVKDSKAKDIIDVLIEVSIKYDNVIVYCGSDRIEGFKQLKKYNGDLFNFKNMEFKTVGDRSAKKGIKSYSASQMRKYAEKGKRREFLDRCSDKLSEEEKVRLYDEICWAFKAE